MKCTRALTAFLARLSYARRTGACRHWQWVETTPIREKRHRSYVCVDCGRVEHGLAGAIQ